MNIHRVLFILVLILADKASVAGAQSTDLPRGATSGQSGSESLGGQLLDDLNPAAIPPAESQLPQLPKAAPRPQVDLAPELRFKPPARFDDLGPGLGLNNSGEYLGSPSGPLPLVRARQGMEQAGTLLAQRGDVNDVRRAQDQVVAQLDELINGLCKQCQGGGNPSPKPPQAGQRSQPKPAGGARPGMSAIAPRDSTDEPRPSGETHQDLAGREELIKQLWGHLPERSREQMMQSYSGEFLPKYELELEKYYRRLTEEQQADGQK